MKTAAEVQIDDSREAGSGLSRKVVYPMAAACSYSRWQRCMLVCSTRWHLDSALLRGTAAAADAHLGLAVYETACTGVPLPELPMTVEPVQLAWSCTRADIDRKLTCDGWGGWLASGECTDGAGGIRRCSSGCIYDGTASLFSGMLSLTSGDGAYIECRLLASLLWRTA
jgi:hypothetical protein